MRTFRLLVWLRWTTITRASSTGNRFATVALNVLFAAIFSPLWLGGSWWTYVGVRRLGEPALLAAFGACQLAWIYLGVLSGALGRSFDLDRWLQFPVRPGQVYAFNVLASTVNPVCIMTLPVLGAATVAVYQRAGAGAATAAIVAALLLTLITAALLQLLLALLDELLRSDRTRFAALVLLPLSMATVPFGIRAFSTQMVSRLLHRTVTPESLLAMVAGVLRWVPTVAAPADLASGALAHSPLRALAGGVLAAAVLAVLLWPGPKLMRRTARGGESTRRAADAGLGRGRTFALPGPLPRPLALLLAREVTYSLENPQRLVALLVTPFVAILFYANAPHAAMSPFYVLAMMSSAVSTGSMMQFAYDGPGVRSYYLLPCRPRDVLLAKNLEFFTRTFVQLIIIFSVISFFTHSLWTSLNGALLLAALAVMGVMASIGTAVSIRQPVRARQRGMVTRAGGSGWGGLALFAGTTVCAVLFLGSVWLARRAAGPQFAPAAGYAAGGLALALGAAIWWRSIDRNASLFIDHREKLMDVIGRIEAV